MVLAAEQAAAPRLASLARAHGGQAGSSNHPNFDAIEHQTDDITRVMMPEDVNFEKTWLEQQAHNQRKKDIEALSANKERIMREFSQLKTEVGLTSISSN